MRSSLLELLGIIFDFQYYFVSLLFLLIRIMILDFDYEIYYFNNIYSIKRKKILK